MSSKVLKSELEYLESKINELDLRKKEVLSLLSDFETEEKKPVEKLSKKQLKKLAKKKEKEDRARQRKEEEEKQFNAMLEQHKDIIGIRPACEHPISESNPKREYTDIKDISDSLIGQNTWLRGRVQRKQVVSGVLLFIKLRYRYHTIQIVVNTDENRPRELVQFAKKVSNESIIDVYGEITKSAVPVNGCSFENLEFVVKRLYVVAKADNNLPIQFEDISRPQPVIDEQEETIEKIKTQIDALEETLKEATDEEEKKKIKQQIEDLNKEKSVATKFPIVDRSKRLDYRCIDMRSPAQIAIFEIQSAVCRYFKHYLGEQGFIEIHSPKILGGSSEGGAEVFELGYFGRRAFLAQSPQLYKQMAIVGDLRGVFEIGPVFRAEKSDTHRHLTEFVGLDLEMEFKQHYHEVLHFIYGLLTKMFTTITENHKETLEVVNQYYPFEPIVYPEEPVIITFPEAVKMLRENGIEQGDLDDLGTPEERALGKLIREKYNTDLFILDKFPFMERSFYTMPDPNDPNYGNAYDIFLRGEEISSGAQRVHLADQLAKQAEMRGVDPASLKSYIEAMSFGANPHAGCGLGLERVVMLFLNVHDVRRVSMFPRDMTRLSP